MNYISIHSIDTVCLKEACPVHHLCARFERYQKLRKSEKVFSILNPDRIACSEQGCAYRLQKKIIRMARGFRRMFGTIPSANTPHFWHFSPISAKAPIARRSAAPSSSHPICSRNYCVSSSRMAPISASVSMNM